MWPAALSRFLRRRLLLLLFAILAVVYILTHLLRRNGAFHSLNLDDIVVERTRPLIWRTLQQHEPLSATDSQNLTTAHDTSCRNSAQGRDLLVDERSFVCARAHILSNGCCDAEHSQTLSNTCKTCNTTTHCCGVYEYCVSCCLHPTKRPLLELVLDKTRGRQALVLSEVSDQFELCLVKCRTNSHSVEHENKYKNELERYCYGVTEAHESERDVLGSAAS